MDATLSKGVEPPPLSPAPDEDDAFKFGFGNALLLGTLVAETLRLGVALVGVADAAGAAFDFATFFCVAGLAAAAAAVCATWFTAATAASSSYRLRIAEFQ